MLPASRADFGFRYASDQSLLVDCADPPTLARLVRWLAASRLEGVRNLHPGYESVLVVFDPLRTTHAAIQERLSGAPIEDFPLLAPRRVEIPVRYGGIDGPDLDEVASLHGLSPRDVIELHASAEYTVRFLGFVPGFAYLTGLPDRLATPRLAAPRPHVRAGSVGIAGRQTGVYPISTPGGWRLIGRTRAKMFETNRSPMCLLEIGDQVRFIPE